MTNSNQTEDLAELAECTLFELCQRSAFDESFVIQCVEHGVAQVSGQHALEWIFAPVSILRIRKAWRLHRDLDLQPDSLALILELLEERDRLLQEVSALRLRLARWEQD